MRVLVTGATGANGRQLVPGLVAAGHEVIGGGTGIWSFIETPTPQPTVRGHGTRESSPRGP